MLGMSASFEGRRIQQQRMPAASATASSRVASTSSMVRPTFSGRCSRASRTRSIPAHGIGPTIPNRPKATLGRRYAGRVAFSSLRANLDRSGFTSQFVALPGDVLDGPPLEGALRIEPSGTGFELQCVDYGQARVIGRAEDEDGAAEVLRAFLRRPMPAPRTISRRELGRLRDSSERYLPELADQIRSSGGQVLIQLPPGIPVDRVGGPDGWLLNPYAASFESRALPPTALSLPSTVHPYVTTENVLVHAQITLPWFGQPGGAVRFSIAEGAETIRDLLVSGALQRIVVQD